MIHLQEKRKLGGTGYLDKMTHTKEFNQLLASTRKQYLHKDVPAKYRNKYGKKYDSKEIKSVAYAIAKSRRIKIDN